MASGVGLDRRHGARELALQMLYQWEVGSHELAEVEQTFWRLPLGALADSGRDVVRALVRGTVAELEAIDAHIAAVSENWRPARMAIVDRLILRLGTYELLHRPDTPRAVVINEALELARAFGAEDSVPFINGVLDGIRRRTDDTAVASGDAASRRR